MLPVNRRLKKDKYKLTSHMKIVQSISEAINKGSLSPGSIIYTSGNAATPQEILKQIIYDTDITGIEMLSVLLLGDIAPLFSKEACKRITHRIIFNGPHSREAVNEGWATYQLLHLSDIPHQIKNYIKPNVVLLTVSGPDNGGNYSLGTTVEGVRQAITTAKEQGGLVIAERNAKMPFVIGETIKEKEIDYLIDTDYTLPPSPVHVPDERAMKIGRIIARKFIKDGCTLQYGIGEVPEAVTEAIIEEGIKDLGVHTELFADAMRKLVDKGVVSNKYRQNKFSVSTLFLGADQDAYNWLDFNSDVRSAGCDYTNSILEIASQESMVAINSAIGVDLHGNIWADSLQANKIYSGIGGQADFLRGSYKSIGGIPIIALKSSTSNGVSKILTRCPEGITTTAIAADPVVIVSEHGAFNPRGLNITEHAVAIAHLAEDTERDKLLRYIYDSKQFHNPWLAINNGKPKGFTPLHKII